MRKENADRFARDSAANNNADLVAAHDFTTRMPLFDKRRSEECDFGQGQSRQAILVHGTEEPLNFPVPPTCTQQFREE